MTDFQITLVSLGCLALLAAVVLKILSHWNDYE